MATDSFGSRAVLKVKGRELEIFRIDALQDRFDVARLPFSLKLLLENLLRHEGEGDVTAADIEALAGWDAAAAPSVEIAFSPARVLMQDFTGVPSIVDLAAMRDAVVELGGDAAAVEPLVPVELVIDHSVQVDAFGSADAFAINAKREFQRNGERYKFLRWGQQAFEQLRVVPPDTGIVHQVNLEYLARVVCLDERSGQAFPDTLVGTDSHTTMVNGLGVLGWGVGGIEAQAAMLGQPVSMLIPSVLGVRLEGSLPEGATATDLVLTVTNLLRERGVVGSFVEFYGPGVAQLPLADRATIGNMSPEFGSTCAIFPIDAETIRYLRFTGRPERQVELVEAYARAQGMWYEPDGIEPLFSATMAIDLGSIVPSIAGPRRPQDRVSLSDAKANYQAELPSFASDIVADKNASLKHGDVVIAAITSCTNTSNPSVMVAAGLLAKKALERGLSVKPWVKTSLAPGSKVVTDYLVRAGLQEPLDGLGFNLVGYGCTTCIGNSGPLPEEVAATVRANDLTVCSVLSGNRNFEARINLDVKMNYLASPPLVVAYALAGTMDTDLMTDPLGQDTDGNDVLLRDLWPSGAEISAAVEQAVQSDMFRKRYSQVYDGDANWAALQVPVGDRFDWAADSTYIRRPPYFDGMPVEQQPVTDIAGARLLAILGDSVTTDHISPAGAIKPDSPAGLYLQALGVKPVDFNSYGSRRGNHEVMVRGTFANNRLRNLLAPGTEGGVTRHQPDGVEMTIYDAAILYGEQGTPLVVLGGREYGCGSSRDWAAKGTALLGVRAVIAESFERIHRSNLIGMGVLALQFPEGENAQSLGLKGDQLFDISGVAEALNEGGMPTVASVTAGEVEFEAVVRIDTPKEAEYFRHGGILPYLLRQVTSR